MSEYLGLSKKVYRTSNSPFAGGGEGDIYDLVGAPEYVAKIYKPDKRTVERERKLSVMANNQPNVLEQYSWPIDILYENGQFVGYVMPKVCGKEKLRNIYVYDNRKGKSWSLYIAIAKNLSAAVHHVHEINQVIGDLNPENILVNPNDGMVTLVDTDSYHIADSSRTYRCGVGMPEFVAPELQGIHFPSAPLPTFTTETDRFALAVLIFALLMNGAHPFACKIISGSSSKFQPIDNMQNGKCAFFPDSRSNNMETPKYAPKLDSLPDNIQQLFRRAFIIGHKNPSQRPSAEEWYYALEQLEEHQKACLVDPQHIYFYGAKECPWCKVNENMRSISQSAFNSSSQSASISGTASNQQMTTGMAQQFTPSNYKYTPSGSNAGSSTTKKTWKGFLTIVIIVITLILMFKSCGGEEEGTSTDYYDSSSSSMSTNSNNQQENTSGTDVSTSAPTSTLTPTPTLKPTSTPIPTIALRVLEILESNRKGLENNGIYVGDTITVAEEDVITYSGHLSQDNDRINYTFNAPRDGNYRFDIGEVNANAKIRLLIWDSKDKQIADTYSGTSETLKAGESYKIQVRCTKGSTDYVVSLGVQKAITDISKATSVNDQTTYQNQRNEYIFTAPNSGRYYFELTETNANTSFRMLMWDRYDKSIMDTNSEGKYVDLEGGETYSFQIRQSSGFGSYKLLISYPKESIDISGYGFIKDSIQYMYQRNEYTFTAPNTGRYNFELTETKAKTSYRMLMWDKYDKSIMDTNSGEKYVDLEEGEVYSLQIRQSSGLGNYKLVIGYQKPETDISNVDVVYDSITFDNQRNIYYFTPSQTRKYTIRLDLLNSSCSYRILIWDEYDNSVLDTNRGEGTTSLEANQIYKIQVRQSSGHGSYKLFIE